MDVAGLQLHFRNIAAFVAATKPTPRINDELNAVVAALEPFAKLSVADFGTLLVQAAASIRAGAPFVFEGTLKPKAPRAPKAPKAVKPAAPAAADVIAAVAGLYEEIAHTAKDEAEIEAILGGIAGLKGPDLQALAERVNIGQAAKKLKVPEKKATIRTHILERRFRFERSDH